MVLSRRRGCSLAAFFVFLLCLLGVTGYGATYAVTNVNDSGAGSLRQAITDANSNAGLDTISFQIPGTGVRTIALASALPTIADPLVIDGSTQPGYTGSPLIEINGQNAANSVAGLRIVAGNSTIRGLAINRFNGDGIRIEVNGTNRICGNYLGTDPSGTIARPNSWEGVFVNGSWENVIGGTNALDRNVIAGNTDSGVYLLNAGGNLVQGNYIGTAAGGGSPLGNSQHGIVIYTSRANQVGGASAAARNVISGNFGSGIVINRPAATANVVQGNFIGLAASGSAIVSNVLDGITLVNGPVANLIGGSNTGEGNVISGNGKVGVSMIASGSTGNVVQGNRIGTDATGRSALGNTRVGVWMQGAVSNIIGGTVPGARNVISGNRESGVYIITNSLGNLVAGNFIGVDITGTNALGNTFNGVSLFNASSNIIGGSGIAARNIVAGNSAHGIQLSFGAVGNLIQGNYIGTDLQGAKALPNHLSGLRVESPLNLVGGTSPGEGNVISGNSDFGILLYGTSAVSNSVTGNLVGTSANGQQALGNGSAGVGLSGAAYNRIGGTAVGAGNLISGNYDAGIYGDNGALGNVILGNAIGVNNSGDSGLGNSLEGIYLENCQSNILGAPGAGNQVAANLTRGLFLTNSSWNIVQGNFVGTGRDGTSTLGNTFHNVELEFGCSNNLIGGDGAAGNVIAWAQTIYAGVRLRAGSGQNAVLGNSIFNNGALGIDLGPAGFAANDPCDTDNGANMMQNFPDLEQVVSGSATAIRGRLNSTPNATYRLQFFASTTPDSSGYGEGALFLGEIRLLAGAACTNAFLAELPVVVPAGYYVTATATDPTSNTSEFAKAVQVDSPPRLNVMAQGPGSMILQWSTNKSAGFVLKQTQNLSPPVNWFPVTNSVTLTQGKWSVALPTSPGNRFYALRFE